MTKKQIVYTVDYDTVEGIEEAEEIQERLTNKYDDVKVVLFGLTQVQIIATVA